MPVEKGDTILVPGDYLGGSQGKSVAVKWKQSMKERSENYWLCKFDIKTANKASEAGVIFIQGSKLDEFKTKKIEGDNLTLKVDDSFQYGQQKDQSHRFLVYHDKGNKPYQHRFIENTITSLGGKGSEFISGMGFTDISKVEDVLKHFVGEYLKDF